MNLVLQGVGGMDEEEEEEEEEEEDGGDVKKVQDPPCPGYCLPCNSETCEPSCRKCSKNCNKYCTIM